MVIGPHWLEVVDGRRRLDDEDDWVRRELLEALKRDFPIIPVLMSGAKLLTRQDELSGRRMILLGDAGAGKTATALQFALSVLRKGAFLPLSTWNVREVHLLAWMAAQIERTYPAVGMHGRRAWCGPCSTSC